MIHRANILGQSWIYLQCVELFTMSIKSVHPLLFYPFYCLYKTSMINKIRLFDK